VVGPGELAEQRGVHRIRGAVNVGGSALPEDPLDQPALLVGGAAADQRGAPLAGVPEAVRDALDRVVPGDRAGLPSPARTIGRVIRSPELNIWNEKRPLSQSQPSSTSALSRAFTRRTRSSRTVKPTLHWLGQRVQTEPACSLSQGRARTR
jgi:hypothetical protein